MKEFMDSSKTGNMLALKQQHRIAQERQDALRAEFVLVELELAITFCQIALSSGDHQKVERNETHADEAHESALRFLHAAQVREPIKKEIEEKLQKLRKLLNEVRQKN